jgi:hypothetical protein
MMNDSLGHDRWLEAEADAHLMRQQREDEARHELADRLEDMKEAESRTYTEEAWDRLLSTNAKAAKAWSRIERGLPPQELACDFCNSMDAKDFEGTAACKSCVDGLRICRECGETEFVDGPEGPTMCVWCRSIDSEYSPDWEDS